MPSKPPSNQSAEQFHLAQINLAQAKSGMDTGIMQGFVERLDEINAIADSSPGFIWRLQGDEGNATSIQAFDDPLLLVNMSVWKDIDSLKSYVYQSSHVELVRDRKTWFDQIMNSYQVLWWIPAGHTPSVKEGKSKLELLQSDGPGGSAFTFATANEYARCSAGGI